jgi:hypothetical protein
MHNTCDCCRFDKGRNEKSYFHAAKKGSKKVKPINQNIVQLTKKIKKPKKVLEKSSKKAQKRQYKDRNSNSKYGVGLG